jgi:peptidyl-prolyl cis-trans isomerase D
MGVFNLLRVKMGSVLIAVIGISIIAFLMGDILGPNSILLGQNQTEVGKIAGAKIHIQEYQDQIEEMKMNFAMSTGRNPNESDMISIRQQAWDFLIVRHAFQKEYERLGVIVSPEEMIDMVQGNNIHPIVQQNFTNPETGQFDREQLIMILQQISSMPMEQQMQWYQFESSLVPARQREKYENLLFNSNIASTEEAIRRHREENEVAEVSYLYVPFYTIQDSLVEITDAKLQSYIDKNKNKFQREEGRELQYVMFEVKPSREDSAAILREMERLKEQLRTVRDDSAFARSNTDLGSGMRTYQRNELPLIIASNLNIFNEGDVLGPYIDNGAYVLYKYSKLAEAPKYSVKASHILIKPTEETDAAKREAKAKAERILREIKGGKDFADMARENGEDGTAPRGGDLGWFTEGMMVDAFNEAVFAFKGKGLLDKVVETSFGYHVIKVTEEKSKELFKIAEVYREIYPSDVTRDRKFREADLFASSVGNFKEFKKVADEKGYRIDESGALGKNQRRIANYAGSREVIRWAFNNASVNQVSTVYELDEGYMVAVLTKKTAEGTAPLAEVRAQATRELRNQLKAEMITKKLASMSGSLDDMAASYGGDAKVYKTSDLKMTANSLPSAGVAPRAVGAAFALSEGERSKPIEGNSGVIVLEVNSRTTVGEIADYNRFKEQIQQARVNTISNGIKQGIEKAADIKDHRYRFY